MAMQRSVEGLRKLGEEDLAKRQEEIWEELRERHPGTGDIPPTGRLPQRARPEVILSPLHPETQQLIERMKKGGYAVYETTGQTPAGVRNKGMKFWYLDPKLEDLSAVPALIAFRKAPSKIFLPRSRNILHDEQVKLLPAEQARVDGAYPGAGLVVREGKLPEWIELAWKHFTETNVRIFGCDYNYNSTWTDTYEGEQQGARRAVFGYWVETHGAVAALWRPDAVSPGLGLAPLVEIPRK